MAFTVDDFEAFTARCEAVVDKWEQKKVILSQRMANICLEEIVPLIPVDTSRLQSSFQIQRADAQGAEIGTNVHYALYVNDGHIQHRRFLPLSYLSAKGRKKYVKDSKNKSGIMLKEKYISGVFFLEKGMAKAVPRMNTLLDSFMEEIAREMGL